MKTSKNTKKTKKAKKSGKKSKKMSYMQGVVHRLQQARDYISKPGMFTKQLLQDDETGAVCMLGALDKFGVVIDEGWILGDGNDNVGPEQVLLTSVVGCSVDAFNDEDSTTQKDAVKAFNAAIKQAKVILPLREKLEKLNDPFNCEC